MRALMLLAFLIVPALADEPRLSPLPKAARPASIEAWGARNASCMEWTDACRTCSRDAGGKPQCSTPGIACVAKAPVCTKQ